MFRKTARNRADDLRESLGKKLSVINFKLFRLFQSASVCVNLLSFKIITNSLIDNTNNSINSFADNEKKTLKRFFHKLSEGKTCKKSQVYV